jgi:hypothetical protein
VKTDGWSEFQSIPNEYNDVLKSIDESLLKLINERKSLSKGKRYYPSKEIMQEWATTYEIDIPQISWLMHSLNGNNQPVFPNEPGGLIKVVSLMKKSIHEGVEYLITHSMQHENGSIVNIEIRSENMDNPGHIRPKLLLDVKGNIEYLVRRHSARGGGGQSQLSFLVSPRLPDDIKQVKLALIPFENPIEMPPKELVLDKEIFFE